MLNVVKSHEDFKASLSVIIPCFNEEATISQILKSVLSQLEVGEVIIVDDGSTDNSVQAIGAINDPRVKLLVNKENMGKGISVWRGICEASLDFVIIQDADLEYDPSDFREMLLTAVSNSADAVFGSRFMFSGSRRALYYWHSVGNHFLTTLSNVCTNLYLTDMETCYKLMRTEVAKQLNLRENRFGIEPEITAKLAKMGCKVYEVPIKYNARSYAEGKKIGWKDGVRALYCIVKYSFSNIATSRISHVRHPMRMRSRE